jgi:hypothetical protein
MYINRKGYLERRTHGGRKSTNSNASVRNWFLIKSNDADKKLYVEKRNN